jgi:hypothetical protein
MRGKLPIPLSPESRRDKAGKCEVTLVSNRGMTRNLPKIKKIALSE